MGERSYQEGAAPRRWRRLPWLFLGAALASPLALWPTSTHFRLAVYQLVYPHLSDASQVRVLDRIQIDEERPDLARRLYAMHDDDPAEAWSEVFDDPRVTDLGIGLRGLEEDLFAILKRPAMARAHAAALRAAAAARLVDPRLPALARPFLRDPALAAAAARVLIINGQRQGLLPVLIQALTPAGSGSAPPAARDALLALVELGPQGRPAASEVRLWARPRGRDPSLQILALAARWRIEGSPGSAARLRAVFDRLRARAEADPADSWIPLVEAAALLAEVGLGDEDIRRVLEENLQRGSPLTRDFKGLHALGPAAEASLPILEGFLDDEDPDIREAARRTIAAIRGPSSRRGR